MTVLGGVTLSDHLVLDGLETAPGVVVNQQRTLTGVSVVQVGVLHGGRSLVLRGDKHFSLAQIQAVKAVEVTAQAVTLSHHRGTFNVLITGTPVAPEQIRSNPEEDPGIMYSGEITMIEV